MSFTDSCISQSGESSKEASLQRPKWEHDSNNHDLILQLVDTDYYTGFPPAVSQAHSNNSNTRQYRHARAVIRLYGITQGGHSVVCHASAFEPYFYVRPWPAFRKLEDGSPEQQQQMQMFRMALEQRLIREHSKTSRKCDVYVTGVSTVRANSMWGYQPDDAEVFIKIVLSVPTLVASTRRLLMSESGLVLPGIGPCSFASFESNLTFILRFLVDRQIVGAGWVFIKGGTYSIVTNRQTTFCSLEVVTRADCINPIPSGLLSDDALCGSAPLRVLSFDIECNCAQGFPQASRRDDQVLQISNVLYRVGDEHPFHKSVFCLQSCAPIAGAFIYCFDDERALLNSWCKFIQTSDPDILTGYNIINFDLKYLLERAQYLKCADTFEYLGRIRTARTKMKDAQFSSRAYGTHKSKDINISGRIQLDLLPWMRREHKLRSYSLNSVAFHFLGQQKEKVAYGIITELQYGENADAETRRRLAVYCLKDSMLPLRLLQKLMILINLIEMARVTGVPINFLLKRGQQIKVLSQLYRKSHQENLLVPFRERVQSADDGFDGATVIEPMRGYYQTPVCTLDFASLYPSIMMAHNLCYTTLITDTKQLAHLKPDQYTKTATNNYFVKASVRKGLLPTILDELLTARREAKKLMKKEKNPFKKAVYNGRQLALKISCNSVYGFTGATVGSLPCLSISASVTAFGRDMIHRSKELVEKHYCVENGYKYNSTVIYGDTDSVMIRFGTPSVERAIALGVEAAKMVSAQFINPIMLEYEKVYMPYLLMNKKRYAGMLWSTPHKYDYMDAKGIETVRRDNCELVKNVVQQVLNHVLIDCDVNRAIEYTKGIIGCLLQGKLDMSMLVITKSLGKFEDYKVKLAHVELAKRMQVRDAASAPKVGDRVAYVITKARKGARAYEKAEDPLYALENTIAIDTDYYLNQQLKKPLIRIFSPILGDNNNKLNDIFHGRHTRHIKKYRSTVGSMMKFTVVKKTCIGCNCGISANSNETLCSHCQPKESLLYLKEMKQLQQHEIAFHQLWAECQRCQGSLSQPVLCSNRDCPIFYRRTKCRKDLEQIRKQVLQFGQAS